LANDLVDRGYEVAVVAEDAAIERPGLLQDGTPALALRADLRDPTEVEKVAREVRTFGRALDVLAINAGVGAGDLNIRGVVQLARLSPPAVAGRGTGRVLSTSSIGETLPDPHLRTNNTSKAFLLSFAAALRADLRDTGVTVTDIDAILV